ncbi:MAG: hypothetical protein V1754_06060, partial [Pseudomonadota bacterium]
EIYRTRLKDFESAIASFEVASHMDPENLQRHEILAELYLFGGLDKAEKAIAEHQILIQKAPSKFDSYTALQKIYMDTKQYDKAWCLCAALSFLKKADPAEQQFFQQYRQRGLVRATHKIDNETWQRFIYHSSIDQYISAIFAAVSNVIGSLTARPHKHFKLKRKDRRDFNKDQLLFSKVFSYVTSVVNVGQADLFLKPDQPVGLQIVHTTEAPSFIVGADLLQGRSEKELAFAIAKQLTYLRPEHFMAAVFGAAAPLRTVFLSALSACNPQFSVPEAEKAEVEKILKQMRGRLHASQVEQLSLIVNEFLKTQGEIDLKKWLGGVEMTATRAGLILCNDLEVAARMVSTEPAVVGTLPAKEKIKQLVLYGVSEEYFSVRSRLGLNIGQ